MARLIDEDPAYPPPLEPLVPALAETLLFWSGGARSVSVVHDEQSALAEAVSPAPPPLRSLVQVDSRDDPRVQVADLLAGIAVGEGQGWTRCWRRSAWSGEHHGVTGEVRDRHRWLHELRLRQAVAQRR
jgi:hypothetical protein